MSARVVSKLDEHVSSVNVVFSSPDTAGTERRNETEGASVVALV